MNKLPALPERPGLICQGWSWSLEDIKAHNRAVNVGAMYITDDGTTRIYITLQEGRTSPMLGVCPNGTVTVDWGDGTEPDVLTGTSTSTVAWTPTHEYAEAGDYVIRLTVDGEMGLHGDGSSGLGSSILRYSPDQNNRSYGYISSLQKCEIGDSVTNIGANAFQYCRSLLSVTIPDGVTSIGTNAFRECRSLLSVTIPDGVTSIDKSVFYYCYSLVFCDFSKHTAVPTLSNTNAFAGIPADCEIRVPAALVDEWKAATNWAAYASQIVAV